MLEFLKRFGLGIFYTIASPFYLAFFLLWFLYTFILFFVELIKGIISFFKGKNFFPVVKEDQEAKIILSTLEDNNQINNAAQPTQQTNQTININLAPGMKPEDILTGIKDATSNINNSQIPQPEPKEIDTNNINEISFDSTNNIDNNNGGVQ